MQNCFFAFSECDCNGRGSESQICEKHTGQCPCIENVTGKKCDKCKEGKYDFKNSQCVKDCKCDALGSKSKECEDNGDCLCKPNIVGESCDQCAIEHFNFPNCTGIYF